MNIYVVRGIDLARLNSSSGFSGGFIKGFKANSPAEALQKAQREDSRYIQVVEYDSDGNMSIVYPVKKDDGIPF